MMKFSTAIAALLMIVGVSQARADMSDVEDSARRAAPLYTCRLTGSMSGGSLAFVIGGKALSGTGYLSCKQHGRRAWVRTPVAYRMAGFGIGFDITSVRNASVVSSAVVVADPRLFISTFSVGASTGVTLVNAGVSVDTAVHVASSNGLAFDLGLVGANVVGLGAYLYGTTLTISSL